MLADPRSTQRVLCTWVLMRLRLGHVNLLGAEFQPPKLSPQSNVGAVHRAASRLALRQISSLLI